MKLVYNLPGLDSYVDGDQVFVCGEEGLPVILENLLESKGVRSDDFHDGGRLYHTPEVYHNCPPQGGDMFRWLSENKGVGIEV